MAITVSAALVSTFLGDAARPGYSAPNMGWNNRVGDPAWVPDIDWYRRVQLSITGSAGEVGTTCNWEIVDSTIPMKTNADLATATAGSTASPYGATINNSDTWTIWVTNGVATAAAAKYVNTGKAPVCFLRANNPSVQVLLGKKRFGSASSTEAFYAAAFLPGSAKVPSGTATITISAPVGVGQLSVLVNGGEQTRAEGDDPNRVTLDLVGTSGGSFWDFGDGTSDDQDDTHTSHLYPGPGTYIVTATARGTQEVASATVVVPDAEAAAPVVAVTIDPAELSLVKGETGQLTATVDPPEAPQDVVWSSSTPSIADIDENGVVTTEGADLGNVTILVRTAALNAYGSPATDTAGVAVSAPAARGGDGRKRGKK